MTPMTRTGTVPALPAAECRALPLPASDKLERASSEFLPGRSDAYHTALALCRDAVSLMKLCLSARTQT